MSKTIADLIAAGPLVAAGWTMLLALWTTSIAALLCAVWLSVVRHGPGGRHRTILVAYACSAVLVMASPVLLRVVDAPVSSMAQSSPVSANSGAIADVRQAAGISIEQLGTSTSFVWGWIPGVAALCWIVGSLVLLARVASGWVVACQIRRRARRVDDRELLDLVAALCRDVGIRPPDVLVSERVEAPVVLGAFRPAILVPGDMIRALTSADIEPLVAHELAHIRRRDYALNLVQSITDALLFFNPGLLWLSARLREAREFSCDDHAVRACGDPARYARALTAMAGLGTARPVRFVLGASGPRLLDRVRRLLMGEARPRWKLTRAAALVAAIFGAIYLSPAVARLSSQGIAGAGAQGTAHEPSPTSAAGAFRITSSYAAMQPGAYVTMRSATVGAHTGICTSFEVTNNANVDVTELTFVAIAQARRRAKPVRIVLGQPIAVNIQPQSVVDVSVNLLSANEVAGMVPELGNHVQVMCGLARIAYANGSVWETRPNPAARDGSEALNFPPSDLPRHLIAATSESPSPNVYTCQDERSGEYSQGAILVVRNEPGTFAECRNGRWIDWVEPKAPPRAP